jgi:hypothetical protein
MGRCCAVVYFELKSTCDVNLFLNSPLFLRNGEL